ncbi:MAG: tetratricopeptide repeat protein [bacterium]
MSRGRLSGLSGLAAAALAATFLATHAPVARAGESARALLDSGLAAYAKGAYDEAVTTFTKVLAEGVDDPVVHYDLGNAYFKSGKLGLAIYHYRRAHALAPRDDDVTANLDYARFLAVDRIEGEGTRTDRRVEGWLDRVTPDEAFRVASLLWVLVGLSAVVWQLVPGRSLAWRRVTTWLLVAWALVFAGAWTVERRASHLKEAVVVAPQADVRNGPGPTFATAFVLHEGAEVVVEGQRGEWTEISLPGDLRGWIQGSNIARL